MKHATMNTTSKEISTIDNQKRILNQNHLYNLLFAGRISLKEYLHRVKERKLQQNAA